MYTTLNSDAVNHEMFGPVWPIILYGNIEEVIDYINTGGKPLGLYIFSQNDLLIDQILNHTSSGGVTINGWALHDSVHDLPFSGTNESDIGEYHGIHGFNELSNVKVGFKTF